MVILITKPLAVIKQDGEWRLLMTDLQGNQVALLGKHPVHLGKCRLELEAMRKWLALNNVTRIVLTEYSELSGIEGSTRRFYWTQWDRV